MDVEQEQTRRVHAEVLKLLSDPSQCAASHFKVSRDLLSMMAQRLAFHMVHNGGAGDGDPDLAALLADVHRIADGVDGIRQLAVTLTSPPAPPAPVTEGPDRAAVIDRLRMYLEARNMGTPLCANVPRVVLRDAIAELEKPWVRR